MATVDVLIQGYPGRATHHGGLGWSTVTLVRHGPHVILVDVGAFGARKPILNALRKHGVEPADVTDVVLTHAHYDHAVNFTLFPRATVWIGDAELSWAAAQPPGFNPIPELYVRELCSSERVHRIQDGETFLPGLQAIAAPGHTPGHLLFYLTASDDPVLFTGDAAKNRAELLSMTVADTDDARESARSLEKIWEIWRRRPGTLLIPGHDLSMRLDAAGRPAYVGERAAEIGAWFSETLQQTKIDLCCAPRIDFSQYAAQ
ncbi:MBL fold metallo-hydrolase [uncultured Pigmentiphaga sp.]|uniref:MBL fold metallo-hydrolase n=3 Tax=Pigmentiphaga TaxID=152267 RepID=UPI0026346859|nr:MBL fold metallo-hydrolase [uncultured Pigmentiphaga sp.]